MRLYAYSTMFDLVCKQGHSHNVRDGRIDIDDLKHAKALLKEYKDILFEKLETMPVMKSPTTEVDDGIIT